MNRQEKRNQRRILAAVGAIVFGAMSLAAPAGAQSGVVMGSGEEILHLLDNNGGIAVDFDVDDVASTQQIVVGRADTDGSNEMNIDLQLIDSFSILSDFDPSIFLNSSDSAIRLGSGSAVHPGQDGDLFVEDGFGFASIHLAGDRGDIEQVIDNQGTQTDFKGNGAVKAWAVIDPAGNVSRCWKCNTDSAQTQRLAVGRFEVDFVLGPIDNRPVLAINSCAEPGNPLNPSNQCTVLGGRVFVSPRLGDNSAFYVGINDENGVGIDNGFTIVVF